jgi:DNA-binding GntR family transcriptional regulator
MFMASAILRELAVDRSELEERVYLALRRKIIDRELIPGTLLTIRQVAGALNVSQTPARDALRRLMADGLLRDRGRHGAEIVGLTNQDVIDIFGARIALETHAVRSIASSCPAEPLKEIRLVLDQWPQVLDGDMEANLKRTSALDMRFHRLIVGGARNSRIAQLYESLGVHLSLICFFHPEVVNRAEINHREHLDIAHAVESGEPEAAAAAVTAHLTKSCEDILRLMSPNHLI